MTPLPDIVVLTIGISGGILDLMTAIRQRGWRSILIMDRDRTDIRLSKGFDIVLPLADDTLRSYDQVSAVLSAACGGIPRHVVACDDRLAGVFLQFPALNSHDAARRDSFRNCFVKSRLRTLLSDDRVDDLPFRIILRPEDLERAATALDPAAQYVLKPVSGTASDRVRGPIRLEQVSDVYREVVQVEMRDQAQADAFLLERWVSGDEFTVEGVVDYAGNVEFSGICQKESVLNLEGGFVYEGANYSPPRDRERIDRILQLVKAGVKSAGLKRAAFHAEIRWDEEADRPRFIELNPRLPGGLICRIHRDLTGIDLPSRLLDVLENASAGNSFSYRGSHVCGDIGLPVTEPGTYEGIRYVDLDPAEVDIVEVLPRGIAVDPGRSENYCAFCYVRGDSHDDFFKQITKINRGVFSECR